jgi:hypothetical protein
MNIEKILKKWFEKHDILTRENFLTLNEVTDEEVVPLSFPLPLEKGEILARVSGVPIRPEVLEELKKEEDIGVLRKYYPNVLVKTLKRYEWAYRKYLSPQYKPHQSHNHPKEKYCNKCQQTKPASEFHISRTHNDGLQSMCKTCTLTYTRNKRKRRKCLETIKNNNPTPADTYAYDEDYKKKILKREADEVLSAIRQVRYDWVPTAKRIAVEKDLSVYNVRAILSTLMKQGKIGSRVLSGEVAYYERV